MNILDPFRCFLVTHLDFALFPWTNVMQISKQSLVRWRRFRGYHCSDGNTHIKNGRLFKKYSKWMRMKISNREKFQNGCHFQFKNKRTFKWRPIELSTVTTIESENSIELKIEIDKALKFIYIEGQVWESAKLQVVRNIEWINKIW